MLSGIPGAVALCVAAALLPSAAMVAPASAEPSAIASDPNRNRYCDHVDPMPPSPPGPEFHVGNGVTAQVNLDIETVAVRSAAGPTWDSTITGIDRYSLGPGWTLGEAFVDVTDWGAKIYVPGHGLMESDATRVSGLACYDGRDVIFRWDSGVVPGRGALPDRAYTSTLAHFDPTDLETPVRTDYFGAHGEVIASIDADGTRTDRLYDVIAPARLTRIVHDDGRETTFSYPVERGDRRLSITSSDGKVDTLHSPQAEWPVPTRLVGPLGKTAITWNMSLLIHGLTSTTTEGQVEHVTEFEWSTDVGRLDALRLDGERVFPLEAGQPAAR